ncbi:M50 family metallopeptidase [Haloimpatiens sp. FM7330]|uniref:M50 family metallopeptidase n=1 Tax=Haloimpatiens sp. FM7330 TaxID=3298610 RepID=UPI0036411A1B
MIEILLFILYAILCFIISSSVHELGHIIIGLMQGFKFYLFIAGPLGFKRNDKNKIVFYIEKNISLWGGLGATLPQNDDVNNFKKFGRVLLGGPITSIIVGVICLPLGTITKNIFLFLLGSMSLAMGVACLIPARNGAFYTDGGRWLRMHKNVSTRTVELAIWNLTQSVIIYDNYEKLNYDEIMVLINDRDVRTQYLGHYYAYYFYKDNNDILNMEKEKIQLENLKRKVPKQMTSMFRIN